MPTMTFSEPTKQETTDFFKRLKAQHANKASYFPFLFIYLIDTTDRTGPAEGQQNRRQNLWQCQNFSNDRRRTITNTIKASKR